MPAQFRLHAVFELEGYPRASSVQREGITGYEGILQYLRSSAKIILRINSNKQTIAYILLFKKSNFI